MNTLANNTINRFARIAAGLCALAGMLALTPGSANAQAMILSYTDPYDATGLTSRQTEVQFHVFNTSNHALSSLGIQAILLTKGSPAGGLVLNSGNFSLNAYEQETISIVLPTTASNGVALLNRELVGSVNLFNWGANSLDSMISVDFVDKLPSPNLVIDSFSIDSSRGYPVVTVTVKNNGTWSTASVNSSDDELSVEIYQNQEGKTLPDITAHHYFTNLAPGAKSAFTFSTSTWSALYGRMYQGEIWTANDTKYIN